MAKPLIWFAVVATLSAGCVAQVDPTIETQVFSFRSYDVIDHFQFVGVPAGATHLVEGDQLDDLPVEPVEAHEFAIVMFGACVDCKGRVYSFASAESAKEALSYLQNIADQGAVEFGWVLGRDNIVVLLDDELPLEWVRQYQAALEDMGG